MESTGLPNDVAPSASSEAMQASSDVESNFAQVEGAPSASSEAVQASSDVESIAEHILHGPRPFTNQSLLSLVDALPMQGPARGDVGRSFAAGAYVHGGLFGLHNNTRRFPKACSVFAEHLRSMAPKDNFTSFVVSDNCCAEVHRDSNNDETRDNILVKISDFAKGEVWLEGPGNVEMFDAQGNSFMGSAIPWDGIFFGSMLGVPGMLHCLGQAGGLCSLATACGTFTS